MGKLRPARRALAALAPVALVAALAAPALADNPVGAPFTATNVNPDVSWCPNFHADNGGCSADNQTQTFENVPYVHAQVTTSGANGYINLNRTTTQGSAVNTQGQESWPSGTTIGEKLNIACGSMGIPKGWFAYWTDSLPGASGGGEMDIAEGLDNSLKWGIHIGSIALPTSGNAYPDQCGVHDFKVVWDSAKAAFYEDGVWQGKVTPADVTAVGGSGWITANQRVIDDYGVCSQSWCNPSGIQPSLDQIQQFWTS